VRYFITLFAAILGFAVNVVAQVKTTDSIFIYGSRPIEFVVDKININDNDRKWITDTLIPRLQVLGEKGIIIGRAAASPEGPTPNNRRLAQGRRASVDALLGSYGIGTDRIRYDVVAEDYPQLRTLMWLARDERYNTVDSIIQRHEGYPQQLKSSLKRHDGGKLWQYLLRQYFPELRAVRIMAIDKALVDIDTEAHRELPSFDIIAYKAPPVRNDISWQTLPNLPLTIREPQRAPRRELLSVKTNVLFDFAYMPGYDRFCPIPNVAVEYYPLHGHFTYGASFDGPWWQNYDDHKYFQLRNYQLHTRYYLRSGDIALRRPDEGAAFKGLYFSAYAHAFIYNICFDANRGWEGEGVGAGLGIGYVLPISKKEHWRLEFGLQAGYFYTPYDPYQWLCPVDPTTDTRQYYYKWYGKAADFKKRQHRYSWFGPTRVEITLSYDLLKRKRITSPPTSTPSLP